MSIPTDLFPVRIALGSARPLANVMKKKHKVGFITVTQATRALRSIEVNDYFGIFLLLLEHFDMAPLWLNQIVKESKLVLVLSAQLDPPRSSLSPPDTHCFPQLLPTSFHLTETPPTTCHPSYSWWTFPRLIAKPVCWVTN